VFLKSDFGEKLLEYKIQKVYLGEGITSCFEIVLYVMINEIQKRIFLCLKIKIKKKTAKFKFRNLEFQNL